MYRTKKYLQIMTQMKSVWREGDREKKKQAH